MLFLVLLGLALFLFGIYSVLPTVVYRCSHKRTFSLSKTEAEILLTFDDGPDPRYTERLLNILAYHKVRVLFFLVAAKAAENPQLVRRMIEEGHLIGFHSSRHSFPWFESPSAVKKDFTEGLKVLNELGCRVHYFRPPWGLFNLSSVFLAKKYHLTTVLWTDMAGDWQKKSKPQRILRKLLTGVSKGSIICLHDSGCGIGSAEGAPEYTLKAVYEFLRVMKEKDYHFVVPDGN